jgi:hypothetical protein
MRALLSTEKCENASFGQKKSMKWCIFWVPNLAKTLTCMELFVIVTYVLNSISKLRNCSFWQMETKHLMNRCLSADESLLPVFCLFCSEGGIMGELLLTLDTKLIFSGRDERILCCARHAGWDEKAEICETQGSAGYGIAGVEFVTSVQGKEKERKVFGGGIIGSHYFKNIRHRYWKVQIVCLMNQVHF